MYKGGGVQPIDDIMRIVITKWLPLSDFFIKFLSLSLGYSLVGFLSYSKLSKFINVQYK